MRKKGGQFPDRLQPWRDNDAAKFPEGIAGAHCWQGGFVQMPTLTSLTSLCNAAIAGRTYAKVQSLQITRGYTPYRRIDFKLKEGFIMDTYFTIKNLSQSDQKAFGLDTAVTVIEKVPLLISTKAKLPLVNKNL